MRLLGLLTSLGCLAVLTVAAYLSADPAGHGTHTQLGLPPCSWMAVAGKPCPTCGMTTAFTHAAEGDYLGSFLAQPLGAIIALLASGLFWVGLHSAATGSRAVAAATDLLLAPRALWVWFGLLAAAWIYKLAVTG